MGRDALINPSGRESNQATLAVISNKTIAGSGLPPMTNRWVPTAHSMVIANCAPPNAAVNGTKRAKAPTISTTPVRYRNH